MEWGLVMSQRTGCREYCLPRVSTCCVIQPISPTHRPRTGDVWIPVLDRGPEDIHPVCSLLAQHLLRERKYSGILWAVSGSECSEVSICDIGETKTWFFYPDWENIPDLDKLGETCTLFGLIKCDWFTCNKGEKATVLYTEWSPLCLLIWVGMCGRWI